MVEFKRNFWKKAVGENLEECTSEIKKVKESIKKSDSEKLEELTSEIKKVEEAIQKSDSSIKNVQTIMTSLQEKLDNIVRVRDSLGKHLETLHNKKRAIVGNFCSKCNATISDKATSNKCSEGIVYLHIHSHYTFPV